MLRSLSIHWAKVRDRSFHSSAVEMAQEVAKHEPASPNEDIHNVPVRPIDRYLLVWSGKYKSTKEVPDRVSRSALSRSHNVCRIKVCNYMMALTLVAAFFYAMSGKRDAEKGLTVAHMNKKWHEEYNKKAEADQNSQKENL